MKGLNSLAGRSKPQSNGPLYSNTAIVTLAIDGWALTFVTARRGLGGMEEKDGRVSDEKGNDRLDFEPD